MRTSQLALTALAPFVAFAMGCTAPVSGSGGDALAPSEGAAPGAASAGLIVIERTVSADVAGPAEEAHEAGSASAPPSTPSSPSSPSPPRASAVARFIKMRTGSLDEQTLRMVGATLDLPALGTCDQATAASPELLAPASSDAPSADDALAPRAVELLDVGALTVEANGSRTTLEARALPDIVDLVTGVLYSTRASTRTTPPDVDALPGRGGYVLRSSGSSATADAEHTVPAFAVTATAPGEPDELKIDGQDARAVDGVVLAAGGRVDLAWQVSEPSDPDDVVYVEIVAGSAANTEQNAGAANVRCLFADRGAASLPASAFVTGASPTTATGEAERAELTHGTLIVHRVHREAFQVQSHVTSQPAIASGIIRFDFARATEFSRR
jgi:hypothetical protein